MRKIFIAFLLLPALAFSQHDRQSNAARIKLKLKKLNFLGSVLYVAAHPDDENTRIITVLANGRLATTGYLSMTRGDGGQNLIGPEIRDLLGLIRTQELLAARRIDGGLQYFTRANDFGYSKSATETFEIWGKDEILSDVVKIFRQYQPDVIITRFPPDERAGHGHHTASAILAGEAFELAAKTGAYPEQVGEFGTWQVKRLYTNTGRWWNQSIDENTPGVLTIDVGGYNMLLGKSYTEISALSSSQHKSQGWGRRGERGYAPEFLEHVKGDKAAKDIFEGVNTTWSRIKNSERVQSLVNKVISDFNEEKPASSVPDLLQLRKEIMKLENGVWKERKLEETEQLIQDCLGLFIEATASVYQASPGEGFSTTLEIVNRSDFDVKLEDIKANNLAWDTSYHATLGTNKVVYVRSNPRLKSTAQYSNPYWLREPHGQGRFTVSDKSLIGLPENPPATSYAFNVSVGGEKLTIARPLIYKWVDRVKGELWRPFEIVPPIFVNPGEDVIIFNDKEPKLLPVTLRSSAEKTTTGNLSITLPSGWRSEPATIPFKFSPGDDEKVHTFKIYPSTKTGTHDIRVVADIGEMKYDNSLRIISYDHFPIQTLLPESAVKAIRIDLKKEGNLVAYIRGAGDDIPAALRNMGYEVWEMTDNEVTPANLQKVDAVVFGIRAFNTNASIRGYMDDVLEYAKNGGTVVVQYNTSMDLTSGGFTPYPLMLSRDRVTEEDSEVRILKPDHAVLNTPNKITAKDFEGWVQERGLYFPNEWDKAFEPVLSMNDKGEQAKNGSLLIAEYGKGYYVYTGLSFFRELPEGVAGAYKLFANIVSLGKNKKETNTKVKDKAK